MLRDKAVHYPITGSHWTSSLLFSLVQELVECCTSLDEGLAVSTASEKITVYNNFVQRVVELGLTAAVDAKPLLDVRLSFPLVRKIMTEIFHRVMRLLLYSTPSPVLGLAQCSLVSSSGNSNIRMVRKANALYGLENSIHWGICSLVPTNRQARRHEHKSNCNISMNCL